MHNQAVEAKLARTWNNLRFRSESEVRIAKALDKAGVLFFPNCMARLGSPKNQLNREPDFLICYEGKWGILEVDGDPFHPPARTAQDHEEIVSSGLMEYFSLSILMPQSVLKIQMV